MITWLSHDCLAFAAAGQTITKKLMTYTPSKKVCLCVRLLLCVCSVLLDHNPWFLLVPLTSQNYVWNVQTEGVWRSVLIVRAFPWDEESWKAVYFCRWCGNHKRSIIFQSYFSLDRLYQLLENFPSQVLPDLCFPPPLLPHLFMSFHPPSISIYLLPFPSEWFWQLHGMLPGQGVLRPSWWGVACHSRSERHAARS